MSSANICEANKYLTISTKDMEAILNTKKIYRETDKPWLTKETLLAFSSINLVSSLTVVGHEEIFVTRERELLTLFSITSGSGLDDHCLFFWLDNWPMFHFLGGPNILSVAD